MFLLLNQLKYITEGVGKMNGMKMTEEYDCHLMYYTFSLPASISGYKFHDADVRVGRSQSNLHSCGHYAGSAQNGERIVMTCPSRSIARFVKIQIVKGTRNVLHVAEVIVWGVRDTGRRQKTSR